MALDAIQDIAGIVLAAGAGRRMGYRPKALLQRDGQPLVARQIGLLAQCSVRRIMVVLGHHAARIAPVLATTATALPGVDLKWVVNPTPDEGTGASLRCALAALPADLTGVMVVLADQPLLQVDDVACVLAAWRARPADIDLIVPTHEGQPGHPLIFGPQVRQGVANGQGAAGVRDWRRAHARQVLALPVDHARCTQDIDTEDDLARLTAEQGVRLSWPDVS